MNRRPALLLALLFAPALALAQWQWVDGSGHRVFSDQPPPPDIPAAKILKQPGGRVAAAPTSAAPAGAASPAPAPAAAAPAARPAGIDPALEAKRRAAETADAAKRKAEEERVAKLRADNCGRAKQAKATLDSGIRLSRTNAQGEVEILDDAARQAEGQRLEQVIASECQ